MKFAYVRMAIAAQLDLPKDPTIKFTTLPRPRKKGGVDNNRVNRRANGQVAWHDPFRMPPVEKRWQTPENRSMDAVSR